MRESREREREREYFKRAEKDKKGYLPLEFFFKKTSLFIKIAVEGKEEINFFCFLAPTRKKQAMNTLPAPASSWEAVAAALFAKDCGGDESDGTRSATPDSENSDAENVDVMSGATTTTTMVTRGAGGGGGPTSSVLSYAAANGRQVRKRTRGSCDRGERGGGRPATGSKRERRFPKKRLGKEAVFFQTKRKSNLLRWFPFYIH